MNAKTIIHRISATAIIEKLYGCNIKERKIDRY